MPMTKLTFAGQRSPVKTHGLEQSDIPDNMEPPNTTDTIPPFELGEIARLEDIMVHLRLLLKSKKDLQRLGKIRVLNPEAVEDGVDELLTLANGAESSPEVEAIKK